MLFQRTIMLSAAVLMTLGGTAAAADSSGVQAGAQAGLRSQIDAESRAITDALVCDERVEDTRQRIRRNTDAVITHCDACKRLRLTARTTGHGRERRVGHDLQLTAFGHGLNRVGYKVRNDLLDLRAVELRFHRAAAL